VRPTAEHVRAALLDVLEPDVAGARVLDLFAGTGRSGWRRSRAAPGAPIRRVPAGQPPRAPREHRRLAAPRPHARLQARRAPVRGRARPDSYDVAFADPPYESRMLDRVIDAWHARRFSRVLAVEHARAHEIPAGGLRRTFDDTVVTIYGV
jgi:16S rRNA (guanine966-N2)-methyltransferase